MENEKVTQSEQNLIDCMDALMTAMERTVEKYHTLRQVHPEEPVDTWEQLQDNLLRLHHAVQNIQGMVDRCETVNLLDDTKNICLESIVEQAYNTGMTKSELMGLLKSFDFDDDLLADVDEIMEKSGINLPDENGLN